jgi:hypothetical protein
MISISKGYACCDRFKIPEQEICSSLRSYAFQVDHRIGSSPRYSRRICGVPCHQTTGDVSALHHTANVTPVTWRRAGHHRVVMCIHVYNRQDLSAGADKERLKEGAARVVKIVDRVDFYGMCPSSASFIPLAAWVEVCEAASRFSERKFQPGLHRCKKDSASRNNERFCVFARFYSRTAAGGT